MTCDSHVSGIRRGPGANYVIPASGIPTTNVSHRIVDKMAKCLKVAPMNNPPTVPVINPEKLLLSILVIRCVYCNYWS